jgi:MerR family transcriptional regulator/heat shock protein HspR
VKFVADLDQFEPVFTIGTIAKKLDLAVQTLRLYEHEGLILPYKTDTRRRMYSLHDLQRLRCIRNLIKKDGLNLQGIKRMMSLVPCWEFKGGLDEDCQGCPAYSQVRKPCWSLENVGNKCVGEDCRNCPVYRLEVSCEKLKKIIYNHQIEIEKSSA